MPNIVNIREHPDLLDGAADYFAARWGIDKGLYLDSMRESLTASQGVPRWYVMLDREEADRSDAILGGFGLIENDFMVRTDLCPWLCALYVEQHRRGHGLGGQMLRHARAEAAILGYDRLWLNTDHIGYYERYDWRYIGDFAHQSGENARVYEADTLVGEADAYSGA